MCEGEGRVLMRLSVRVRMGVAEGDSEGEDLGAGEGKGDDEGEKMDEGDGESDDEGEVEVEG